MVEGSSQKGKPFQVNCVSFHFKQLEKEEYKNPKKKKIIKRSESNEIIGNRKQ